MIIVLKDFPSLLYSIPVYSPDLSITLVSQQHNLPHHSLHMLVEQQSVYLNNLILVNEDIWPNRWTANFVGRPIDPRSVCSFSFIPRSDLKVWVLVDSDGVQIRDMVTMKLRDSQCSFKGVEYLINYASKVSGFAGMISSVNEAERIIKYNTIFLSLQTLNGCMKLLNGLINFVPKNITIKGQLRCIMPPSVRSIL